MFTYNNVDEESLDEPATWFEDGRRPDYCVWQLEQGVEGTFHLQGYVTFAKRVDLSYLKQWLVGHWTRCDGNHSECIKYCTKEDDTYRDGPWEYGVRPADPERGKRNDIVALREAVRDGATDKDLFDDDFTCVPAVKYIGSVSAMRRVYNDNDRRHQTHAVILYGPPGTGKTTKAHQICADLGYSVFVLPTKQKMSDTHWFCGYDGQDAMIVNEMSGAVMRPDFFCDLIDRHPLVLPKKNGQVSFVAKLVIFTSNKDPRSWWSQSVLQANPGVLRRMKDPLAKVFFMNTPVEVTPDPFPSGILQAVGNLQADDLSGFGVDVCPKSYGDCDCGAHHAHEVIALTSGSDDRFA